MCSIACKRVLVAADRADATWMLVPKHEWNVAAGAALVWAFGGWIALAGVAPPTLNQPDFLIDGFIAASAATADLIATLLGARSRASNRASRLFSAR